MAALNKVKEELIFYRTYLVGIAVAGASSKRDRPLLPKLSHGIRVDRRAGFARFLVNDARNSRDLRRAEQSFGSHSAAAEPRTQD